jgi:hypothetical protein
LVIKKSGVIRLAQKQAFTLVTFGNAKKSSDFIRDKVFVLIS